MIRCEGCFCSGRLRWSDVLPAGECWQGRGVFGAANASIASVLRCPAPLLPPIIIPRQARWCRPRGTTACGCGTWRPPPPPKPSTTTRRCTVLERRPAGRGWWPLAARSARCGCAGEVFGGKFACRLCRLGGVAGSLHAVAALLPAAHGACRARHAAERMHLLHTTPATVNPLHPGPRPNACLSK